MADQVNYSMNISVVNGPSVSASNHFNVDAMDRITAAVPKTSGDVTVQIQPNALANIKGIMITSDNYDTITFKVDGGSAITLDGPLMLLGSLVALLGATCTEIEFLNGGASKVANITVLVVREAIAVS